MTSVLHYPSFGNMSILAHQPPRLAPKSRSIKSTAKTLSNHHHPNPIRRRPLLSISQLESNNSAASSSNSSTSPVDFFPPQSATSVRPKRSKRRSARAESPLIQPLLPQTSGLRSRNRHSSRNLDVSHQEQTGSDSLHDFHQPMLLHCKRLELRPCIAPSPPPAIPDHIIIPRSLYSHPNTPVIEPSYEVPRRTSNDTHTCVRTEINSYSVSISTQPPAYFSKTNTRLNRVQKSHSSSLSSPDAQSSTLEMKRMQELDKWWYWSTNCKITGDSNKSSHLNPLRCQNLKRKLDDYSKTNEGQNFKIHTEPISESALEQQKFYYSG